ncbi:MAG TPA: DUF2147 domain-containing protein [Bacteroidales bacterium]|nr:DUF2147 domain-containing protein [Bacteroidales bacterium]HNS47191.1 DUF2147 domain-containing protein [Bacteroidales bacterium]
MNKVTVFILFLAGMLTGSLSVSGQVVKANDILGFWLNEEKDARIEITVTNGRFFGKIVWLEEPNEDNGLPKVDEENPDPALQKRPIMGLEILKDFVFDKDEWSGGTIYDPDNGKTYKCTVKKGSATVLNIRGYIGKEWMGLGRTTVWTRP